MVPPTIRAVRGLTALPSVWPRPSRIALRYADGDKNTAMSVRRCGRYMELTSTLCGGLPGFVLGKGVRPGRRTKPFPR